MRTTFIILAVYLLAACSTKTGEPENASTIDQSEIPVIQSMGVDYSEPVIGERIDGPANIRDGINGKLLFTLNNDVLVSCTPLENDWYSVGIFMDIDTSELTISTVKKGRKIIVDGKEVGEIKSDMTVYPRRGYPKVWIELTGHTHKDNIKPGTIIENALVDYLRSSGNGRTIAQLQPFIQQFELERSDQFKGYTLYTNYENWLDDPSPMWRIGLVFRNDRLVSILHSRPLDIAETTDYKLLRGFDCLVYNDVANPEEIVMKFSLFVNSVD
ncbi:MAG: hypothetical protein R2824_03640 [Saprospiraceae bacterium]|nr:hypothetical protein [Lewinella sp.]